ncbi:MAG: diaminopimelate epimerase [Cyclobacteriaceae bacterium]
MNLAFTKYQGTGNDFILIDNREELFPKKIDTIQKLCDRRFGVGADGLILIENHPELDYKMIYYNSDGSQSLCGNGSRCGFAFARSLGIAGETATFETTDGIHRIKEQDGLIHFSFFDIKNDISEIGMDKYLNTGSPHYIRFVKDIDSIDVFAEGREIRNLAAYSGQNGTNVNFAHLLKDRIKMRTYERGVEDETLSCGTGATAVALIAGSDGMDSPIELETKGGNLRVFFKLENGMFTDIWLAGPAEKVFEGTVII